ncbi:MAG: metalloregulator ArsR/SmtB family transcription factor [Candidatus Nanopelagicales bacterium]
MKIQVERDTRSRVTRSLLEDGPATTAVLAGRLGLTAAAVRRHLDALVLDGDVEARERPPYGPTGSRGRGRPAKVFALTDTGRAAFPQAYDDLAVQALRRLATVGGEGAVLDFARNRLSDLEHRYAPAVAAAERSEHARTLARALSVDGFAAAVDRAPWGNGQQLCQHHCPVAHVAAEFPELCEAETEMFARLLGTHVQRLATIGHGDHVCTTYIPEHTPQHSPELPEGTTP